MIEYVLGVVDLADTRFSISPLTETVFSLWALRGGPGHALHRDWLDRVGPGLDVADTALLTQLVGPTLAVPDFLTPRPTQSVARFDDELTTVRHTPPDSVERDLQAVYAPAPLPPTFTVHHGQTPAALRDRLCDALHRYWQAAIEPSWPAIRYLLEADVLYRARRLTDGGASALFADLHPNLHWHNGVLRISKMIGTHRIEAAGRGLTLVPSAFAYKPVPPISAANEPTIAYPVRGQGTLWDSNKDHRQFSLDQLLGQPRSQLLQMLDQPRATVDIARRLQVSPSAISQHLRILLAAGLITRTPDGRRVLYTRNALGDDLVRGHN